MVFRCILILDKSRLWTPIKTKCSFLSGNRGIISQLFSNKRLSVSFAIHISSIFSNYFSELGKNMFRYISVQITNDNNSSLMLLMTKLPLLIQNKVYHFWRIYRNNLPLNKHYVIESEQPKGSNLCLDVLQRMIACDVSQSIAPWSADVTIKSYDSASLIDTAPWDLASHLQRFRQVF